MSDKKVATDVAEAELARFADAMDLNLEPKGLDEDERKALDAAKRVVVEAIEKGRLTIDEKGQPVFTPNSGSPIVFSEPTGAVLMAADAKKKDHSAAKLFAMLAEMTGQSAQTFAKMPQRDLKVCSTLFTLFFA